MDWKRGIDEEEIRWLEEQKQDIPQGWRPSHKTIAAISGQRELSAPADTADALVQQQAFRDTLASMTPQERGGWGERAVFAEARGQGHRILLEHTNAPTARGYDCVSWDSHSHTLHIWEAKNYSGSTVQELGALDADKRRVNVEQFLKELSTDDADRPAIVDAVQQDRVQWHIRLGPDTDVSFTPLDRLAWGSVDVKQYTYGEMLRVRQRNR